MRRGFGFKNRNFGGFSPVKEVQKTIFDRNGQASGIISVFAFIWLWVIAFAFSGGASISPQPRELTEEDAGRALTVKVGDTLALKLRNPATGGYDQVTPAFDAQILKLVSRRDLPPEPSPIPRYGDFGKIVFELRAISPGETDLIIRIARKWETKPRPEEYFRARIRVVQ